MPNQNTQQAMEESMKRHNARSLQGLTLRNAVGDIDTSGLGYQVAIDTLTFIKKQITEQKFYQVAPADYVPISVGDGAFQQNILTNMTVNTSGNFEEGIINQGIANDRLAIADSAVSTKTMKVANWAKGIGYSVFEIEQALQANNWDIIESKHRARKTNWDLGIQRLAFLGISGNTTNFPGLLNQASVNSNTTLLTTVLISDLTAAQFSTFVSDILAAYQSNCNYTAFPTHFIIPQDDWVALAVPVSSTYPVVSKLTYLKDAFDKIVPGGVKMIPSAYAIGSSAVGASTEIGLHRYCMYRYDAESLRMDIPVDYTVTQPNTMNNFQFQDAAYGQFTGVGVYRPLEIIYFDMTS
jgi:hypothetical protein